MGGDCAAGAVKVERVFQRLPDPRPDFEIGPWQARMDQLLLSDPVELLGFVSDAMVALAAQMADEEQAWELTLQVVDEASDLPERKTVIDVVRRRLQQLQAVASEQVDANIPLIMQAFHKSSREAPWPKS